MGRVMVYSQGGEVARVCSLSTYACVCVEVRGQGRRAALTAACCKTE